ncbi:MAG: nucleotidyl transferase AbiEii/AbiGii toxin family protein [Deltaproteobacteria bacterium]|nr:nucleotidyl transferase AbiEii/AbiGii toxin family protein [Deltaproteobacteria bacterium]
MKPALEAVWETLFRHSLDILDSVAGNTGGRAPVWTVGGGTMLMRRYHHRESKDVDIFLDDAQWLGTLTPRLNAVAENKTTEYLEQGGFLKLYFPSGEVDFIVAGSITDPPFAVETVLGREVRVETDAEIIGKKLKHRAAQLRARDIFDVACVLEKNPSALDAIGSIVAVAKPVVLARLSDRARELREDFRAIARLDYRPTYEAAVAVVTEYLRRV